MSRKCKLKKHILFVVGVVPENPKIGSDGESEEVSDDVISPVKLRPKNRRLSEVIICFCY